VLSTEYRVGNLISLLSTLNSERAKRPANANGTVLPHAQFLIPNLSPHNQPVQYFLRQNQS